MKKKAKKICREQESWEETSAEFKRAGFGDSGPSTP